MRGALGCFSSGQCTLSLHAPVMVLWFTSLSTTYCTVITNFMLHGCMRQCLSTKGSSFRIKIYFALVVIGVIRCVKTYDILFQEVKCSEYSNIWASVLFFTINLYPDKLVICTNQSNDWYWKETLEISVLVASWNFCILHPWLKLHKECPVSVSAVRLNLTKFRKRSMLCGSNVD